MRFPDALLVLFSLPGEEGSIEGESIAKLRSKLKPQRQSRRGAQRVCFSPASRAISRNAVERVTRPNSIVAKFSRIFLLARSLSVLVSYLPADYVPLNVISSVPSRFPPTDHDSASPANFFFPTELISQFHRIRSIFKKFSQNVGKRARWRFFLPKIEVLRVR